MLQSPPRRWIQGTLGSLNPMGIGPVVRSTVRRMSVATLEANDELRVSDFSDRELAAIILEDRPRYRCGKSTINGRAHGAWAHIVVGELQEAWMICQALIRLLPTIHDRTFEPDVPVGQYLLLLWLALRLDEIEVAYLAQRLVSRSKRSLNRALQEDFKAMTEELLARANAMRPSAPPAPTC